MPWEPGKWDGGIWDSTDSDEAGSPDEFMNVKSVIRQKMALDGQNVRADVVEDFTQHKVKGVTDRFKQRLGESLLFWMVHLHDQGAAGVRLDTVAAKKSVRLSSGTFVQDAFRTWPKHGS